MSKNKKPNKKKPAPQPKKTTRTLDDYSLEQLVTMPMHKVIQLMMNDPENKDFVYPYSVVMEVYTFIENYKDLQAKCLSRLMADLKCSNILNGNRFTMDRRATTVIKATAKTASFKELDTFKSQAQGMYEKLIAAQNILLTVLSEREDMDYSRKFMLRQVMADTKTRLLEIFRENINTDIHNEEADENADS